MSQRTFAEVCKLRPGDAYVVHSAAMRQYVMAMIADRISPEMAKAIRIFVVRHSSDVDRLAGWRGLVLIDHIVQSYVPLATFLHLVAYTQAINARHADRVTS